MTFFFWLTAYTYGTLLSTTEPWPIPTVLYYHLLAPCLSMSYFTTFYWPNAYTIGTLLSSKGSLPIPIVNILPSTGPLPMPMLLYYILLTHCVYLWYSTIFYWLPAYSYGILLPSTGSLPIPMLLFHFYWPTVYHYSTLLTSTSSMPIPIVLYYILLAHCRYLWYSTYF